jgi:Undecaprenyl-phosphate galactose phosphotransferase WbaP
LSSSHSSEILGISGALIAVDVTALVVGMSTAAMVGEWFDVSIDTSHATLIGVVGTNLLLFLSFGQLYPAIGMSSVVEFQRVAVATTLAFACYSVSALGLGGGLASPWPVLMLAWGLTLGSILVGRSAGRSVLSRIPGWGVKTLITGDGDAVKRAYEALWSDQARGLRPVAVAEGPEALLAQPEGDHPYHCVVLAMSANSERSTSDQALIVRALSNRFDRVLVLAPEEVELDGALWMRALQCGPMFGIEIRDRLRSGWNRFLKRVLDLSIAILTLPMLALMTVVLAVVIKSTSRGPIFYGSERIGEAGRIFKAWKFRTMRSDADDFLISHLARDANANEEWQRSEKLNHDPRVTKIGHWLRISSLDELPQIWNVLRGEMSTVGPRPILPNEVSKYGHCFDRYTRIKPGITGLWQVSGRNETSYAERLRMVSYYLQNWSLWLDLYILAKTVRAVVSTKGAR